MEWAKAEAGFARTEFYGDDEYKVRLLIDKVTGAIKNRDMDEILAIYSDDAEIFDVRDSLRYFGKENLRKSWQECFDSSSEFEIDEVRDLKIQVDGNVAFSHCLNHAKGVTNDGEQIDIWMRLTSCLRKIGGHWLVVHEHVSAPGDFVTGRVLQDLKPEDRPH